MISDRNRIKSKVIFVLVAFDIILSKRALHVQIAKWAENDRMRHDAEPP